jgi:hypothetical protein
VAWRAPASGADIEGALAAIPPDRTALAIRLLLERLVDAGREMLSLAAGGRGAVEFRPGDAVAVRVSPAPQWREPS